MVKGNLNLAREQLREILIRESKKAENARLEYRRQEEKHGLYLDTLDSRVQNAVFISRTAPEIIGRGLHQIVLRLDNNYAAKFPVRENTSTHYGVFMYASSAPTNQKHLRLLGFNVPVEHYFRVGRGNENYLIRPLKKEEDESNSEIIITDDLTINGGCLVEDIEEKHFTKLENGVLLKKEYEKLSKILINIRNGKNRPYILEINKHISSENPEKAIKHIFLMQINKKLKIGTLFAGDLDHIMIYRDDLV